MLENSKLGKKNVQNTQMKEKGKGVDHVTKMMSGVKGTPRKEKRAREEEEIDFQSEMTNLLKEKEAEKQDEKDESSTHEQLITELAGVMRKMKKSVQIAKMKH